LNRKSEPSIPELIRAVAGLDHDPVQSIGSRSSFVFLKLRTLVISGRATRLGANPESRGDGDKIPVSCSQAPE